MSALLKNKISSVKSSFGFRVAVILMIFFSFLYKPANSQCSYTFNMSDSYGDGWNGGYLEVYIDGLLYGTYSASGYGSTANINITAGQSISVTYYSGSWESENSYNIDLNGSIVYSAGPTPTTGTIYTYTCPGGGGGMTVPSSGSNSYTICSGNLYDVGGSAGSYTNSCNGYTVLTPSTAGNKIQISGSTSGEACCDYVQVYNGSGTGGTLLGTYYMNSPIPTLTSSDASGALTVLFYSDGSVVGSGFDITISCVSVAAYQSQWITMNTGAATWCAGETRSVSVTVQNIGSATWTDAAPDINIGCKWNSDADYFVRVHAGGLAPGSSQTYSFSMTAPGAGAENLSFDIVNEGNCWFGNNSGACGPGNIVYTSPAITINSCEMTVPNSGTNTYNVCSGNLYDNGGSTGNYTSSCNGYSILNPSISGNKIQISGTTSGESCCDYVQVYNGSGTGGLLLGTYYVNTAIPTLTSTDATGALTVLFYSDGSITGSGFNIAVSCIAPAEMEVPSTGSNSYTVCSGQLYDDGGSAGNYDNSWDGYTILYPTAGNMVQVSGIIAGESCCDYLYIYNGIGTGGTLLWSGVANSGAVPLQTSTDASGALTIRFTSDGSVTGSGFDLTISCVPAASAMMVPSSGNNSYTVCSGHLYDFGGSGGDYSNSWSGYTVLYPTGGNLMQVSGTISGEACCDYLYIYNGVGTGGTLLWSGVASSGTVPIQTSTDASGALTVMFTSDGSVTGAGFDLTISCIPLSAVMMVPNTGSNSYNVCAGHLYDFGGSAGDYSTSWSGYTVLTPSVAGNRIQISGTSSGEACCDYVRIYNGSGTGGTVLGTYYMGTAIPTITSSDPSGILTVYFYSDGSVTGAGFDINIACVSPPAYQSSWVSMNTGAATWCAGETRNVTVTVTNTGTATWTDGAPDVNIGCKWNGDPDYLVRVNAGNLVSGATQTYTLTMTAPAAGANNLTFDIVVEGDCWFANNTGSCGPGNVTYTSSGITVSSCEMLVPSSGNNSFNVCSGHLYDNGGSTGDYGTSWYGYTVLYPSVAGNIIEVSGTISGEACCDYLYIYNGVGTGGTLLWSGVASSGAVPLQSSTDPSGALTVLFSSDGSVSGAGFDLTISCVSLTPCAGTPAASNTNASPASITSCLSTTSTLSLTTTYSGAGWSYQWQMANTSTGPWSDITGATNTSYIASITANVWFRCVITCTNSGISTNSTPVNVTTTVTTPPNNEPCYATPMGLGTILSDNNNCSNGANEPGAASCWTAGSLNTLWYSIIAPTSGQLRVRTTLASITATQIALYQGTCSSLTEVASGCNQTAPICGWNSYGNSEITVTGLTPGATYYVCVDGRDNYVGSYNIAAIDPATTSLPGIPGQDCVTSLAVCSDNMSIGDPGYQALGNICDHTGDGNCTDGEKGSAWYTITIASAGTLYFNIIPNDATPSSCLSETDYDFVMWKIAGAGATNCANIISSGGGGYVSCNFSAYGITGLSPTGGAPLPYSTCFDGAYEPGVAVAAGEVYLLAIQNFANSTSGFTLDLTSTAGGVVNYTLPPSLTWTGGAETTAWGTTTNWGGCSTPNCAIDAVVTAASSYQPVITGSVNVKNLTINPGATLTLNAGAVLTICGNLTNNGIITASPTSTILFNDNVTTHQISGNIVGTSKLGNLTITDQILGTNCTVTLNNDIDVGGNLTTSSNTSILNTNSRYISVAGNVSLSSPATYSNIGTGTLEFNGTALQTYTTGSDLTLNNVVVNNSGAGVSLSNNLITGNSGILTFNNGIVTTGGFIVRVNNTAPTAVNSGNPLSFVNGNLRRYFANNTGTYYFPVGVSSAYRLAELKNNNLVGISYLDAFFTSSFTNSGSLNTAIAQDGGTPYSSVATEGIWQITPNAAPTGGSYDIKLYIDGFSGLSDNQFAPLKRPDGSLLASAWTAVGGTINAAGTPGRTVSGGYAQRSGWTTFSQYSIGISNSPLPIELSDFQAYCFKEYTLLKWSTSSETNNDYFTLEKSGDGNIWSAFNIIPGAGNSNTLIHYDGKDYDLPGEDRPVYYRLKQTDYDGQFSISPVISINCYSVTNESNIYISSSSETGDIVVSFAGAEGNIYMITVVDMLGRKLFNNEVMVTSENHQYFIEGGMFSSGVYNIVIQSDKTVITKQVVMPK